MEEAIGTSRHEEVIPQKPHVINVENKKSIAKAIWDYNMCRPNQEIEGHSPNSMHHTGRTELMNRRMITRHKVEKYLGTGIVTFRHLVYRNSLHLREGIARSRFTSIVQSDT